MKVIDHAVEVLPQCPPNIAAAVQKAADTVVEQGKGFADDVTITVDSAKADMQKVVEQMKAIPDLLNPQAILDCCTGVLEQAVADLRKLASDAAAIPQRLLDQTAGVQAVVDSANQAVASLSTTLPELQALVPDFSAQMAFFNSMPSRGQALADLAKRSGAMVEQYGRDLLPLSQQLKTLARLEGGAGAGNAAVQDVISRAEHLQSDTLAQIKSLRDTLDGNVTDLDSAMQDATELATKTIGGVSDLLNDKASALLDPLQASMDLVDHINRAIGDEARNCEALFDDASVQLDRVSDILFKPLAEARAQVDKVIDQISDAAATVDTLIHRVMEPIDALETRVHNIEAALQAVLDTIRGEIDKVLQLMRELDEEAENAKATLRQLPDNFIPVRTAIADAIAMLTQVKDSIPPFVAEANGLLDTASSELDQADVLCTNAIEICTRYQMKAPPLMVARRLFVGIKGMIPGVKTAIASARTAVKAAADKASALMDQAIGVVDGLNPLLEQAVAQVQVAIDTLIGLLEKMQAALKQVSDAAEKIPPVVQEQFDKATAAVQQILDQVRSTVQQCLEKLQCEALVQRLKQQLSDLLDQTFKPLEAQIKAAGAPLKDVLAQGKQKVGQAAAMAQEGLDKLSATLATVQQQARQPVQKLTDMLSQASAQVDSVSGTARQQVRQGADQALSYVDQASKAIEDLPIREVGEQIAPFAQFYDDVAGTYQQAASQVRQAGDVADKVNQWKAQAQAAAGDLVAQAKAAAGEALQGAVGVQSAADETRAGAQQASDSMSSDSSVSEQVQASFDSMKQDADSVAAESDGAMAQMSSSLEESRAQSADAMAPHAPDPDALTADVKVEADKAQQAAQAAKESEQSLAAQVVASEKDVGSAATSAESQTTAMKDEAQAGINQAKAQAESVEAQVNAARADAIKAETIVAAEVEKHGGAAAPSTEAAAGAAAAGAAAGAGAGQAAQGAATDGENAGSKADAAASKEGNSGASAEEGAAAQGGAAAGDSSTAEASKDASGASASTGAEGSNAKAADSAAATGSTGDATTAKSAGDGAQPADVDATKLAGDNANVNTAADGVSPPDGAVGGDRSAADSLAAGDKDGNDRKDKSIPPINGKKDVGTAMPDIPDAPAGIVEQTKAATAATAPADLNAAIPAVPGNLADAAAAAVPAKPAAPAAPDVLKDALAGKPPANLKRPSLDQLKDAVDQPGIKPPDPASVVKAASEASQSLAQKLAAAKLPPIKPPPTT